MVFYSALTFQSLLLRSTDRTLFFLFCIVVFFVCSVFIFGNAGTFTIHQLALSFAFRSTSPFRLSTFLPICYKYFTFLEVGSLQVTYIQFRYI